MSKDILHICTDNVSTTRVDCFSPVTILVKEACVRGHVSPRIASFSCFSLFILGVYTSIIRSSGVFLQEYVILFGGKKKVHQKSRLFVRQKAVRVLIFVQSFYLANRINPVPVSSFSSNELCEKGSDQASEQAHFYRSRRIFILAPCMTY